MQSHRSPTLIQSPLFTHTDAIPPLAHTDAIPPLAHPDAIPPLAHTDAIPPLTHTDAIPPLAHTDAIPLLTHTDAIPSSSCRLSNSSLFFFELFFDATLPSHTRLFTVTPPPP
ncbi:hypothetical protein BLNAU_8116 [Blattamonas nauphoetae]|uniref:Uncharacterized protein n=1 Tax=Blattamonas nauphoetae TaxID=2049346 RepID=A0ABQ9XZF5_9EUKA|nr:hypothetical protein BLNAU_8116 [Blattamonas nauphoetae]